MSSTELAAHAARLLTIDLHTSEKLPLSRARRRARDAVRGVTLLDAEPAPLQFSMDDYRDATRADAERALAWLEVHTPPEPPATRVAATRAVLAVLWVDDLGAQRHRPTPLLGQSVLSRWDEAERRRVAALLFEVGLLRSPSQPDGPLWHSPARSDLRFHLPTALRLFPDLRQEEARATPAALPLRAR
jgi:hypothetical protein